MELKEGDWAIYNWLDDEGNDNWKIGKIVQTEIGLMYFNDDGTERSGYMPITVGVRAVDYSHLNDDELFRVGITLMLESIRNIFNMDASMHAEFETYTMDDSVHAEFEKYTAELERRKMLKNDH